MLCVIGHNGAGKSTLMRTLFGLAKPEAGRVLVDGNVLPRHLPRALAAHGVAMVPEGRGIFPGPHGCGRFSRSACGPPALPRPSAPSASTGSCRCCRRSALSIDKRAGLLSGGQQQMVSIGRALLARPRCLLMDEPSIGLAPKLFQDLLQPIRALQRQHAMSILLIEQNVREALKISDRVAVMKAGAIILEAVPAELADNARLMELY